MEFQKIKDCMLYIIEHIDIIYINAVILGIVLILNIFYMGRYWKQLKNYKGLPWAFHITEKLYKNNKVNITIRDKIKRLYVCDNWEDKIKQHYYKKISLIIGILIGVNIFFIIIFLEQTNTGKLINNQYIKKPMYGESSQKVNLDVSIKDSSGKKCTSNIDIYVEPNRLSKKEEEKLISKVKKYIRKNVIGKNKIYGHISSKLNLITTYKKDKNIKITWTLDEYGLISSNGDIQYDSVKKQKLNKGIDVVIIAKINYFNNEYEYPLYMTIYNKNKKENIDINKLKEEVNELNTKYNDEGILNLPKTLEEKDVSYSENIEDDKFSNSIIVIIMGVILIYIICKTMDKELDLKNKNKNTALIVQYGEILNKIQLLICAGLDITGAWEKICKDYLKEKEISGRNNFAYEEMLYTYKRYNMGLSQREAFREFGKRIGLTQYIKMSSLILQNMKIGTEGFIEALEIEIQNSQNEQKELYIKQGQDIGLKLLLPMIFLMVITISLVIMPAFMSM